MARRLYPCLAIRIVPHSQIDPAHSGVVSPSRRQWSPLYPRPDLVSNGACESPATLPPPRTGSKSTGSRSWRRCPIVSPSGGGGVLDQGTTSFDPREPDAAPWGSGVVDSVLLLQPPEQRVPFSFVLLLFIIIFTLRLRGQAVLTGIFPSPARRLYSLRLVTILSTADRAPSDGIELP